MFSLLHIWTFMTTFRAHMDNLGESPHLRIFNLIMWMKSLLPHKVIYSEVSDIGMWTSLYGSGGIVLPHTPGYKLVYVYLYIRSYNTVLLNGCPISLIHRHQQYMEVQLFHIPANPWNFSLFNLIHPKGCKAMSYCGFNIYFPDD